MYYYLVQSLYYNSKVEIISQTDLQNPISWNDEGVGNGHAVGCFDN